MTTAQKIMPFLWFDDQAEEAAKTYVSIFGDGRIGEISRYSQASADIAGRPAGSVMTVSFEIAGQGFTGLNGGPHFTFTPAVSFFVNCADAGETDAAFNRLADGGTILMPLQEYPFSARYGWVQDRYGLSWQVNAAPRPHKIAPCFLFVGAQCGRAEEALRLYTSLFPESDVEGVWRYGADETPDREGTVRHGIFRLAGQEFRAMDSALDHAFTFNEAISLQVHCDTQDEIDRYWKRLTEGGDPKAQQCGWLKDRFGVSWQIVPKALFEMLRDPDPQRAERVTEAFLQMKKFDIGALERAFEGKASCLRL